MSRHYCLIPDIRGESVLAISAGEGLWTLPAIEHDGDWIAWASITVARAASARFGIPLTAVHEYSASETKVCELEIQAQQWTPPPGTRWITKNDVDAITPEPLSSILRTWFAERGATPSIRPPWERRGWYAEAVSWILVQCARLGFSPSGPVEQLKAAWSLSTIMRIGTSAGDLYFKADYAKPPSEPAIIEALARRWPRNVPSVVAADHERGWMLMRDFGGRSLEGEPIARWQAANRTFSSIQLACSADLEPWLRLGCPNLGIPVLVAHMDRLLADSAALRVGETGGLTAEAAAQLRNLMPRLHAMWSEMAAIPVPSSVVAQDFRHSNLVLSGRSYLFYDWSDIVISHPFFSCCRFLDFVPGDKHPRRGLPEGERKRRIADAYLQPWLSILGLTDLRRAFSLAQQLNPIYLAIRWYLEAPYCEPDSFWSRTMHERPANELRRLLVDKPVDLFEDAPE